MKVFILVIIVATVIGGFISGEVTDQTFTIWGAAVGGVGTFAVLMGLGAFFSHQEKQKDKAVNLTPEMKAVFGRMIERQNGKALLSSQKHPTLDSQNRFSIEATVQSLIDQDLETIASGKIPERRLIPHHAIKRDVILKAFNEDFQKLPPSMQDLNREHFQSQIEKIRQLDHHDLDRVISMMKKQRTDLVELERQVREKSPLYSIVDPLF
jgi:hypothetical protein